MKDKVIVTDTQLISNMQKTLIEIINLNPKFTLMKVNSPGKNI